MKQNMLQVIETYARQALRTICMGYKDLQMNEGGPTHEEMDEELPHFAKIEKSNFVCVCIIGIKDIIRPEVPLAVATCKSAGVRVRMVTGDNKITAIAIAKECGIINNDISMDGDAVLEGPDFFERMGGLFCKTCKNQSPCQCEPKLIVEGVRNI
jgi:Ca2+ transporting ATPase